MNHQLEVHLSKSLKKLEKALEGVLKTQGYNGESEKLKMLHELVKEQRPNENTRYSARTFR